MSGYSIVWINHTILFFHYKVDSMDKKSYKPRIIDKYVDNCLAVAGAVCIEGPKWCGKTWTSEFHSNSAVYIGDPAGNYQNRNLALLSPAAVLEGQHPRLIDEWQEVPPLWDAVRSTVDQSAEKGQFILTGSATPDKKGMMHSGAGRIVRLRMRPMSLFESGDSSGEISLQDICAGTAPVKMTGQVSLDDLITYVVRGGWPGNLDSTADTLQILPRAYMDAVINEDLDRIDERRHDISKMEKLLKSLARNESTTASNNTLRRDISGQDEITMDPGTISEYIAAFNKIFLLDDQPPFSFSVRSSARIKKQAKRHFADPSLAAALLKATPEALKNDLNTFGFLFEAMCERDLRIYAESFGGQLSHYQDYRGREINAVVEMPDGKWAAIEIKLGAHQVDSAAENLIKIRDEIKRNNIADQPVSLIVVCGMSNAAYLRPDGVYVVPISALRP